MSTSEEKRQQILDAFRQGGVKVALCGPLTIRSGSIEIPSGTILLSMTEGVALTFSGSQPPMIDTLGEGGVALFDLPPLIETASRNTEDHAVEIVTDATDVLKATLFWLLRAEGWTMDKAHIVRRKAGLTQ